MLFQAREDYVTYWQFLALSVGAVCGKKLHGTYSFDGNTNNIQGDEPRTTALERQVQTLIVAVKHLIKQNHNLEEQLRQKECGA